MGARNSAAPDRKGAVTSPLSNGCFCSDIDNSDDPAALKAGLIIAGIGRAIAAAMSGYECFLIPMATQSHATVRHANATNAGMTVSDSTSAARRKRSTSKDVVIVRAL